MKPMAWRIYYDDGTTWDHSLGLPRDKRRWGVLAILLDQGKGHHRIMSNGDFYLFDGVGWFAVDLFGMADWVVHRLEQIKLVLVGRMVPDERFREVYAQVKLDADNGVLTGGC